MSVANDPRLPATTPRPVPPPPPTGAGHPLHTPADAQRMQKVPVMRATRHARYAPAQWRDFYLTAMRRVDFAAYSRFWGTIPRGALHLLHGHHQRHPGGHIREAR